MSGGGAAAIVLQIKATSANQTRRLFSNQKGGKKKGPLGAEPANVPVRDFDCQRISRPRWKMGLVTDTHYITKRSTAADR